VDWRIVLVGGSRCFDLVSQRLVWGSTKKSINGEKQEARKGLSNLLICSVWVGVCGGGKGGRIVDILAIAGITKDIEKIILKRGDFTVGQNNFGRQEWTMGCWGRGRLEKQGWRQCQGGVASWGSFTSLVKAGG